jgi:hypothetical protein
VNILIAAEAKFMMKVLWEPLIEGYYYGGYRKFKDMNPDAKPTDYIDMQNDYDAFQRGDW